jgi:hypothetical protein
VFFDKQNSMEKCTGLKSDVTLETNTDVRVQGPRCNGYGVGTQLGAEHVVKLYYQHRFVSMKSCKANPRKKTIPYPTYQIRKLFEFQKQRSDFFQ